MNQLSILKRLFGEDVRELHEGGLHLFSLPEVPLPPGCHPVSCAGLYVASAFQGYASRLFLASQIRLASGRVPPVTALVLLGRTWYAASIGGVSPALPPHQAILAHLRRYEAAA